MYNSIKVISCIKLRIMEKYQIKANEEFFLNMLRVLHEGGTYIWKDQIEIYTKKGDRFVANKNALDKVKQIVSDEFFTKHFTLKK